MTHEPTLTTVKLDWKPADPKAAHAFEAVTDTGVVFKAYRHRTDYGWSWFSITKSDALVVDAPSYINSGSQTELPRSYSEWR